MLHLPVEINPFYLIFLLGFPLGFFAALVSSLVKPVIGLGKTVAGRLNDPNRDIFGRKKSSDEPDPVQEGLRAAASTATANIQSRQNTALSDIGLAPKPIPTTNIALVMGIVVVVFMIAKK